MPGEHDKFGAPYRPPCQGWPDASERFVLGPMFNHYRKGEAKVQKYHNVTSVPNPICPDSWPLTQPYPVNVPPYIRPPTTPNDPLLPGRNAYPGDAGYCDPGHDQGYPFAPWLEGQFPACTGGERIDLNCYSLIPDEYVDLSICRKLGFKNVQARKFWYGRFGFDSTDGHDCGVSSVGCGEDVPGAPDGTKYLTQRIKATLSLETTGDAGGCSAAYSYSVDVTLTIDRYTGIITQSGYSYSHSDPDHLLTSDDGTVIPAALLSLLEAARGMFCAQAHDADWNTSSTDTTTSPPATITDVQTWDHDSDHCKYERVISVLGNCGACGDPEAPTDGCGPGVPGWGPFDQITTRSFESWLSGTYTSAELVEEVTALLAFWDLSDDATYPWRVDAFTTVAPMLEYDGVQDAIGPQCAGNLPDDPAWYEADYVDANAGLYSGEILGKPLPYPGAIAVLQAPGINTEGLTAPRVADFTYALLKTKITIANNSGVKLLDGDLNVLATGQEGTDYTYDSATGEIVFPFGSSLLTTANPGEDDITHPDSDYRISVEYTFPLEAGGHFDRRHMTTHFADDFHGPESVAGSYTYGYGAWSGNGTPYDPTDTVVPRCATHWTENRQAQTLPHGAWQIHQGGLLWMQKWAEIKTQRPSQSFFGPCGAQRFEMDATKTSCVAGDDEGSPPIITVGTGEGTRFTTGDKVIYWKAEASIASYYPVASVSGDDVHLGDKLGDIPGAGFTGGSMLGVAKWPDAWSICGRAKVFSVAEDSGTVTVELAEAAPCLVTGDAVDFVDENNGVTDSNKTVTVIDSTHFSFTGSAPMGNFIKSHGAPAWWFLDTNPKGDFLYFDWTTNNRDYLADDSLRTHQEDHGMPRNISVFTAEAGCVPFTPCCPSVLCVSPNFVEDDEETIDGFINGAIYGFDDFTPDDRFGSKWQAVFRQTMDELFFNPPVKPCSDDEDPFGDFSNCTMVEDLSSGEAFPCPDDTCFGVGESGKFYYPHRRVVEARMTVPTWTGSGSAPALPSGIFINYLSLDDLDTAGSLPDGLIALPPDDVGAREDPLDQPNVVGYHDASWRLYIDEQYCVCANGRFAGSYLSDWAICGLIPT